MSIRRVVPNIRSEQFGKSEAFYVGVLGFQVAMNMGWIMTLMSPSNPTAQISVLEADPSGLHPNLTVEVDDVDQVHAQAVAQGVQIVYPLTDEPWGVRRFFAVDPNGLVVNIVSHRQ